MPLSALLKFSKSVELTEEKNRLVITSPSNTLFISKKNQGLVDLILELKKQPRTEKEMQDIFQKKGKKDQSLDVYLYHLKEKDFLTEEIILDDKLLFEIQPAPSLKSIAYVPVTLSSGSFLRFSRFAYMRVEDDRWVIESPLTKYKIIISDSKTAQLLYSLNKENESDFIYEDKTDEEILRIFCSLKFLFESKKEELTPEEVPPLNQWEFHDLLFHARSREGRHSNPSGGTFRFLGKIYPLPLIKEKMSDVVIKLDKPDMDELSENDYPFTRVLENRRSIREHATDPITLRELGEFLFRSTRIQDVLDRGAEGTYAKKPYPCGGGIHELEIYPVIWECKGLNKGMYHYDPYKHLLEELGDMTEDTKELLSYNQQACDMKVYPQVLLCISARFQRVSWKYEAVAYSLILKNLGCLYQTFYLVATAMNLAPCAVGCGNSDLFSRITGDDYYTETMVGEFILGSKKT